MKPVVAALVFFVLLLSAGFGAAAEDTSCNNASFMSRRCNLVFAKACAEKGQSEERCRQMRGYCHACTDQYLRCKSSARAGKSNSRCAPCNEAYDACLVTMKAYYIDAKPE